MRQSGPRSRVGDNEKRPHARETLRIAPSQEGTLKHRVQRRIHGKQKSVGGRYRLPRPVHLGSEHIGSAGYRSAGHRTQGISLSATR